ncbi:unnamed protein product [Boreogadus saida]
MPNSVPQCRGTASEEVMQGDWMSSALVTRNRLSSPLPRSPAPGDGSVVGLPDGVLIAGRLIITAVTATAAA